MNTDQVKRIVWQLVSDHKEADIRRQKEGYDCLISLDLLEQFLHEAGLDIGNLNSIVGYQGGYCKVEDSEVDL